MTKQLRLLELEDSAMLEKVNEALATNAPAILEIGKTFARALRTACGKMGLGIKIQDADDKKLIKILRQGLDQPSSKEKARSIVQKARVEFRNLVANDSPKKFVPADPRLLEVPENERDLEGLVEFKQLLGAHVGAEANALLEYLSSEDWKSGFLSRMYLQIKVARAFQKFWEILGGNDKQSFRFREPEKFQKLQNCFKKILGNRDVKLTTFQDGPGKFEHDINLYEAQPPVTFYQSSIVEEVVHPGLLGQDGRPEVMAIVKIKKE